MTNEPVNPDNETPIDGPVSDEPTDEPFDSDPTGAINAPAEEPFDSDAADAINERADDSSLFETDQTDEEPIEEPVFGEDDEAAGASAPPQGEPTGFPGTAMPAASYVPLQRDAEGVFGGIASGIGKRYGLDIGLVRLGMAILAFTVVFILVYIAAWIIIPKSAVPLVQLPHHPDQTRRALGGALVGAAVIFGLGAIGSSGAVLVPVALLAAGIWLLMQQPKEQTSIPGGTQSYGMHSPPAGAYGSTQPAVIEPVAIPTKKRRTGLRIFGTLVGFVALLLLVGVVIIGVFVASGPDIYFEADNDNFRLDFGDHEDIRVIDPDSLAEVPTEVFDTEGKVVLDLTEIDLSEDYLNRPYESNVTLINGEIEVTVPDGLDVRYDVETGDGSLYYDGLENFTVHTSKEFGASDPDLILNLEIDSGQIVIVDGLN